MSAAAIGTFIGVESHLEATDGIVRRGAGTGNTEPTLRIPADAVSPSFGERTGAGV
jgi:hypothetical protein